MFNYKLQQVEEKKKFVAIGRRKIENNTVALIIQTENIQRLLTACSLISQLLLITTLLLHTYLHYIMIKFLFSPSSSIYI